jgi:hypothetical protein
LLKIGVDGDSLVQPNVDTKTIKERMTKELPCEDPVGRRVNCKLGSGEAPWLMGGWTSAEVEAMECGGPISTKEKLNIYSTEQ